MDKMIDNLKEYINFLESSPIYSSIEEQWENISAAVDSYQILVPDIMIYCDNEICKMKTIHNATDSSGDSILRALNLVTFKYECKHCEVSIKIFNLLITKKEGSVHITKIGEYPPFGPHIPASASKLLSGSHRDLFMKGLSSESQNLGIGAFIYYRRTLDSIKNDLIDEMIKVATTIQAPKGFIASLKEGRKEDEFSKSVNKIKKAIPSVFKIDGHNPLTMLNTALNKGLHNKNDQECLEYAQAIRTILFHLLDRLAELRKDNKELKETISRLNQFSNPQGKIKKVEV